VRLLALFGVATLAALAIQTIIPYWFPIRAFIPHLILILSVDLGFRHPSALAAVMAFAMGYATDALSGSQIGLNAFTVTLVFLVSYEISRHLLAASDLVGSTTVFTGALINSFGAYALASNPGVPARAHAAVTERILIQALITALSAPLVFALLRRGKSAIGLPLRNARE
jgi:rod shape-determining protein MreD